MTFSGMSPEQIEECARALKRQGQELTATRGQISGLVQEASVHWLGPDLRSFQTSWSSSGSQRMGAAIATLTRMADHLSRQAAEQRTASQAQAGGGGALVGGSVPTRPDPGPVSGPGPSPTYAETEEAVRVAVGAALAAAGLSPEEKQKAIETIATRLDATPEPWRSLYLDNLAKLDIAHDDGIDHDGILPFDDNRTDYYQGPLDTIHVNLTNEASDPRGPFYTLFHELGHGVDDKEELWGMATTGYTIDGHDLDDALRADVIDSIFSEVARYSTDPEQQKRVVSAIMNNMTGFMSPEDLAVANNLQAYYDTQVLAGPAANVASDIFGAMTGNFLGGPGNNLWGHEASYWDSGGKNASHEFWAGYAADQVEQSAGLTTTQSLFPTAHEFADQMAKELAS